MRLTLVSAVLLAVSTMVSAAPHLQERAVSCTAVSGVCGKGQGNGATGACCTSDNDCQDTCNSSGCGVSDGTKPKSTCPTVSTTVVTTTTKTTTTTATTTPGPICKVVAGVCGKGKGNGTTGACCTSDNDCQDTCNSSGCGVSDGTKPNPTCPNVPTTTLTTTTKTGTTTTTTATTTPGSSCKVVSGVCGKGKGNGTTGACCTSDNDCQDTCNSSGCGVSDGTKPKSTCPASPTTTLTTTTKTATTTTTTTTTTPGSSCKVVSGVCGKGKGNGTTGACCTSDNDCQDTCNSSGCGVNDGTKPKSTCPVAAPTII